MAENRISVVIPARNAASTLPDTLAGIAEQHAESPPEVIVVDDGSTDATRQVAADAPVVTQVVHLGGAGPAQARNAGAAAAHGESLAFLDADCRPTPGWLRSGQAALQSADLVIGRTLPPPNEPVGPFDRTLYVVGCSPLFESANLFVRRDLFERLGGFEHWLGPQNGKELGEDVWFGWSAVRAGARVAHCHEALVHHAVFPRGPLGFAAERWRLRFFPAMAHRMPELRHTLFHRRLFLNQRQARFDVAALALLVAKLLDVPVITLAAVPYARMVARDLREPRGAMTAAGRLGADAVGCAGLLVGSVRYRSLVL